MDAATPPIPPVPPGGFAVAPVPFPDAVTAAASALEARLERFPSYPDLWNRLGLYQASAGRLLDAGASFERALTINPRFLGAVENRAWLAVATGDDDAWKRFLEGPESLRLHPGVRMVGRGGERFRLPCFWFAAGVGVLPAFGAMTGTAGIAASAGDRVYAIAESSVIPVPTASPTPSG